MNKAHVTLSPDDRQRLAFLRDTGIAKARVYKRVISLLELDRGKTYTDVAAIVGCTIQTLSTLAAHYQQAGLVCLQDKPRSGRPLKFDGLQRAKITALACSDPPEGYGQWSLQLLADQAVVLEYCESISGRHVGNILKKTNSSRI